MRCVSVCVCVELELDIDSSVQTDTIHVVCCTSTLYNNNTILWKWHLETNNAHEKQQFRQRKIQHAVYRLFMNELCRKTV